MKDRRYTTGFLFSTPSFLSGAATVINIAGNYYDYNSSEMDFEADGMAIEHDFRMIGQDICDVVQSVREKHKTIISR